MSTKSMVHQGFAIVLLAATAACGAGDAEDAEPADAPAAAEPTTLVGTSWQLVQFQSSSDEIGTLTPEQPYLYTMSFRESGDVTFSLDCNAGSGTWSAEPPDAESGSLTFGSIAITRALCSDDGLGERIARDAAYVRTYLRQDGRLHLSLMADGGIYTWEPAD